MPELPEVETIRRDLESAMVGKKINSVKVFAAKSVKVSAVKFKKILVGRAVKRADRIGKLLVLELSGDRLFLLVHLKMTGQLIYCAQGNMVAGGHSFPGRIGELPGKHARASIIFDDHSVLYFNDSRRFGYLDIVDEKKLDKIRLRFGISPLSREYTTEYLLGIFTKRKASIKAVLLDQPVIAGIGNIYADEILFAARVRPDRPADSVSPLEAEHIRRESVRILNAAIKYRGTTFNDYVDANGLSGSFVKRLKVYGRQGKKCFSCSGTVEKTRVAGRGTHFCPNCQK